MGEKKNTTQSTFPLALLLDFVLLNGHENEEILKKNVRERGRLGEGRIKTTTTTRARGSFAYSFPVLLPFTHLLTLYSPSASLSAHTQTHALSSRSTLLSLSLFLPLTAHILTAKNVTTLFFIATLAPPITNLQDGAKISREFCSNGISRRYCARFHYRSPDFP